MAAPGVDILSTYPTDDLDGPYAYKSGTSMASPQVAGIAALVAAANPSITKRQVRARILATVSPLASLSRTTATGGTADADAAVKTSLSVARSLEVYGTVKNGSSTLAGVSIRARATDGSGVGGRTTSKSDGTFILAGLTPGTYVVTASKTGTRFRRRSYEVNLSKDSKLSFAVAR